MLLVGTATGGAAVHGADVAARTVTQAALEHSSEHCGRASSTQIPHDHLADLLRDVGLDLHIPKYWAKPTG
jgi:hypothetical protein